MADILPDNLAKRTSSELLEACGRLQEAYTAALEREAKERETAAAQLRREAAKLAALLGPEDPPSGISPPSVPLADSPPRGWPSGRRE